MFIVSSVTFVGYRAFFGCSKLEYTEEDNAKYLGNTQNPYALLVKATSTNITSCTINEHTKSICPDAFNSSSLESITVPDSVTYIGKNAFYACHSLKTVVIGSGVTAFGEEVFNNCENIESITVPFVGLQKNGTENTAFFNLFGRVPNSLKTVVITGGGTIANGAFAECSHIESVTISGVTSIGEKAFYRCSALTDVTIADGLESIGSQAFYNNYGYGALENISIPDSITFIDGSVFINCDKLKYTVYDNAKYLGNSQNPYAVLVEATDSQITSCTIHANTKIILYSAFMECRSLGSIIIPEGVTQIGYQSFRGCVKLTSITLPDSLIYIDNFAFYNCSKLTEISIPDGVTKIGEYTFYQCSMLTDITIPDGVTEIGIYAFAHCSSLKNITLPDNLTKIDNSAFYKSGLESIIIPDSVTEIVKYAFQECSNLTNVKLEYGQSIKTQKAAIQ